MDVSSLKKNSKAIRAGQWIKDIPQMGDLRLRVRGLNSPEVIECRAQKERAIPLADRRRDGTIKTEDGMRIMSQVLFEAVLLDWDGLTQDGKPLPYNKDLAEVWLTDPDYMAFADAVAWSAQMVDRGMGEIEELATEK